MSHLITSRMNDHWEAVVIGGRVAKNIHNRADLVHLVEAGYWRAHDLPVVNTSICVTQ